MSAFPLAGACLASVSPLQRSIGGRKSGGTAGGGSSGGGQTPGTIALDRQPWRPSENLIQSGRTSWCRLTARLHLDLRFHSVVPPVFLHTHEGCSATSSKRVHQAGFKGTAGRDRRHPAGCSKGLMLQQAALGVFHGPQFVKLGEWLLAGDCGTPVSAALARWALANCLRSPCRTPSGCSPPCWPG